MPEGGRLNSHERLVAESVNVRHVDGLVLHGRKVLYLPLRLYRLFELLLFARSLSIALVQGSFRSGLESDLVQAAIVEKSAAHNLAQRGSLRKTNLFFDGFVYMFVARHLGDYLANLNALC